MKIAGRDRIRATNRFGGGEFAARRVFERPRNLLERPILTLAANIHEGVCVNMRPRINGQHMICALTAPMFGTERMKFLTRIGPVE
ncbi:MAG: hypothetical protein QME60_08145 [Verrucomicrobiota bacterium]|nr:hypothetical protein [Verrucomicrobiota bacterium]